MRHAKNVGCLLTITSALFFVGALVMHMIFLMTTDPDILLIEKGIIIVFVVGGVWKLINGFAAFFVGSSPARFYAANLPDNQRSEAHGLQLLAEEEERAMHAREKNNIRW